MAVHKSRAFVVLPTARGLDVLPAAKQLRRWQGEGVRVVVQLQLPGSGAVECSARDLLHAALLQGWSWGRFLPQPQRDRAGRPKGVIAVGKTMRLPPRAIPAASGVAVPLPTLFVEVLRAQSVASRSNFSSFILS